MAKSKKSWWKTSIVLIVGLVVSALFAMSYFQTAEKVKATSPTVEQTNGITKEENSTVSGLTQKKMDSIDFHLKQAEVLKKETDKITAKEKAVEVSVPQPAKVSVPVKKQEQSKKIEQKKTAVKEKQPAVMVPAKKVQETKTDESSFVTIKKEIPISSNTATMNQTETLVSVEFTKLPVIEIQNIEVKEMERIFSQQEIHSMTASLVTDVREVKKWRKLQKDNEKTEAEIPISDTTATAQADTVVPIIAPVLHPVFDEEERMREVVENTEIQPTETKIAVEEKSVATEKIPISTKIEIQYTDTALIASEIIPVGNSKTGMYHIMKENNKPMYTAAYDTVLPVTDMGTAFVCKVTGTDTLWNVIDMMSDTIRKTEFKRVEGPHYGLSIVTFQNGKHAHANQLGKQMYSMQFDGITPFHVFSDTVCAFGQITGIVTVDTQKIPDMKYPFEKKKKKTVITVTDPTYQIFTDGSVVLYDYR